MSRAGLSAIALALSLIVSGCADDALRDIMDEYDRVGRITDKIRWTDNGRTNECYAMISTGRFTRMRKRFDCDRWHEIKIGRRWK